MEIPFRISHADEDWRGCHFGPWVRVQDVERQFAASVSLSDEKVFVAVDQ